MIEKYGKEINIAKIKRELPELERIIENQKKDAEKFDIKPDMGGPSM